jgi:hypothetical protein
MANSNGWGDGSVNNNIGWGQAPNNNISWGKSQITSWSGATDIDGGNTPVNTVAPVISGSTSLGSVLTTTNGTWTSLTTLTYTYQWYRGATLITSATNQTYTLVVADSAASITCKVTATNILGSNVATSNAITAQTFSAPVNTVAPAITGTAQEGQTLTCSTGTWTGNPTPTYTYQWKRNGSNIGSATNSTYVLVTADVGQSIKCTVTATNAISSVNADSNTVTPTSSTDADAQAFITAAAITNPMQQSAINTLVVDLKAYSIWTKFKAIYPIVGGTASQHKFNLKDPRDLDAAFRLTFATGWTHSSTGMLPNGATFANTFLIENTSLNTNDSHISVYSRTNITGTQCDIGAATGTTQSNIFPNLSGIFYPRVQASNAGTVVSLNTQGLFMANRVNSTQVQGWRNTTKYTITSSSTGKVTVPFWLGDLNNNGVSGGVASQRQLAFASIGDGLTDTDAANFYTAVNAYQVALSRNI